MCPGKVNSCSYLPSYCSTIFNFQSQSRKRVQENISIRKSLLSFTVGIIRNHRLKFDHIIGPIFSLNDTCPRYCADVDHHLLLTLSLMQHQLNSLTAGPDNIIFLICYLNTTFIKIKCDTN